MDTNKIHIHTIISRKFRKHVKDDWLKAVILKTIELACPDTPIEVGVVITGDKTIQRLNRLYRGKNEPTDVLAFHMSPQTKNLPKISFVLPPDGMHHLGEVIISYPQAEHQSQICKQTVAQELKLLIVHGVLHLLGYEHETPDDRRHMRKKEREILAKLSCF